MTSGPGFDPRHYSLHLSQDIIPLSLPSDSYVTTVRLSTSSSGPEISSIIQPHYLSNILHFLPLATFPFKTKHTAPVTHFQTVIDISEQFANIFNSDVNKHAHVLLVYAINTILLIQDIPPCFFNHTDSAVNATVGITTKQYFIYKLYIVSTHGGCRQT
jgi:hypothetical protein